MNERTEEQWREFWLEMAEDAGEPTNVLDRRYGKWKADAAADKILDAMNRPEFAVASVQVIDVPADDPAEHSASGADGA